MKDDVTKLDVSVVFRKGPITEQDYDDAIAALQEAKTQLAPNVDNCHVCGDSGCWAGNCRHNPLVMARLAAARESEWRCFHCNAVFTDPEAAEEHFGKHDEVPVACRPAEDGLAREPVACPDPKLHTYPWGERVTYESAIPLQQPGMANEPMVTPAMLLFGYVREARWQGLKTKEIPAMWNDLHPETQKLWVAAAKELVRSPPLEPFERLVEEMRSEAIKAPMSADTALTIFADRLSAVISGTKT